MRDEEFLFDFSKINYERWQVIRIMIMTTMKMDKKKNSDNNQRKGKEKKETNKKNNTYLRCIRINVSRASWSLPIFCVKLSCSLLSSSISGKLLIPVCTNSSLNCGICVALSIGTCSGRESATNKRRTGLRGVALADKLRARIYDKNIY